MAIKKSASKTKTKVKAVFNQAKASLKILESLERGTRTATNVKLLAALRKIGLSSADEVESLRLRIERLEAEVANLRSIRGSVTMVGENIPQG